VKTKSPNSKRQMPEGYDIAYPKDSTEFIKISVEDVIQTLFEAIILVVVVMYLFLQNIRATLIPALAVPVVLLGTFGVLALFGYSINTLTLFAMVLAIGLLVDDAIVVVENVERIMRDEGAARPRSHRKIDGRNLRRAGRHCPGAVRRCSCRWPSSAARPGLSIVSSRSPLFRR
jgi:multidrug efflux pump